MCVSLLFQQLLQGASTDLLCVRMFLIIFRFCTTFGSVLEKSSLLVILVFILVVFIMQHHIYFKCVDKVSAQISSAVHNAVGID